MTPPPFQPLPLFAALALLGSAGCRPEAPSPTPNPTADRSFTVRGVVRDIPAHGRALLIRHDEIPGYMPRMTMELTLLDTNEAGRVQVGNLLEFRLVARADDHFIDQIRVLTNPGPPTAASQVTPPEPATRPELRVGDPVPDFELLTEHNRGLRLSDFRGRAVAFTFFFTRCPLPDFCPRMNRNLLEARDLLLAAPAGPTNWSLLSISFDPAIDRPAVLAAHARTYRGTNTVGWEFAVADTNTLARLRPAFDLKIAREEGGFSHNLRTIVVDPLGKVARQFDGNRWTAADLAQAITAAARPTPGP